MERPATAAFLGTSLDGFIALPDGGLDWLDRGPEAAGNQDHGYDAFFASVDAILLGRATWDVVRGFPSWPYGEKPVSVLTHRPEAGRHGERCLAGPPAEVLAALGAAGARRVYLDGGSVVSQFLAAGLLDELTISVLPVVLGAGIALFQGAGPERWLRLASCRPFPGGMVQLRYLAAPA